MEVNIKKNTIYPELLEWVENGKHFSFARYNDGEWGIILKKQPHYGVIESRWGFSFDKISDELLSIVEKPLEYFVGIPPKLWREWRRDISSVLNNKIIPVNSETLHELPMDTFKDFLGLLKTKNTILVGPKYLNSLDFYSSHIIIPEKRVWDHTESIMLEIRKYVENNQNPIIIYSASIGSNIMIDRLYNEYKDTVTQIDLGSTLDPHAGVISRSGHRKYMEKNGIEIKRVFKKGR